MALSFIGKPISLISHSDVRYKGVLAGIDPAASTIQLSKVYSMGTESRRPPSDFIPPVQDPYEYIIFRASEVKDLAVDEPAPLRSVHDDPAVLGASQQAPGAPPPAQYPYTTSAYVQQPSQQRPTSAQPPPQQSPMVAPAAATATSVRPQQTSRRSNPNNVHTAAASLETVERALGDLRVSNGTGHSTRGGRRGAPAPKPHHPISVPTTDFDFQSSNARFEKRSATKKQNGDGEDDVDTNPSDSEDGGKKAKGKDGRTGAYNPSKSFFDSLTPGPQEVRGGGGGRGFRRGGGPGMGRNRREEERERNVATFGEPGGVGLMGPGAYVGGWGGYGRRGGPRGGRRGRGLGAPGIGAR